MTRSRNVFILFALLFTFGADAFASGFQLNECGARALAQAGAFAARANDASAIFFNPAGLAFQKTGSVYLGTTIIIPKASFYGPLQNNTNAKTEEKAQTFTPINAYISYPLMSDLVVGVGVNNPFGLGTEWPATWAGRFLSIKADLKSFFFTPTFSYRITDELSVGVGVSIVTGSVKLTRAVAISSVAVPTQPEVTLDLSATGYGVSAGILYKALPELSFGLSYRSDVPLRANGTATFNPNYAALGFPQGDASAAITLPGTGFFGVAYKPMDNLEVEADAQYIQWSSYSELAVEFKQTGTISRTPKNYQKSYILRIGGEYTLDELHLRGGYFYDKSPVKTQYVDPILPDASRHGFNIGLGYDISSRFTVDVAYLFLKFLERKVENSIQEISFDGTYHTYANLYAVNFGFTF